MSTQASLGATDRRVMPSLGGGGLGFVRGRWEGGLQGLWQYRCCMGALGGISAPQVRQTWSPIRLCVAPVGYLALN